MSWDLKATDQGPNKSLVCNPPQSFQACTGKPSPPWVELALSLPVPVNYWMTTWEKNIAINKGRMTTSQIAI